MWRTHIESAAESTVPLPEADEDEGVKLQLRNGPGPASVSKLCDDGGGILDPEERMVRECDDAGNDGVFTIQEEEAPKMTAADPRGALISKKQYRRLLIASAVLLTVSWLGNSGLILVASVLAQKVETQSGDLTDESGKILASKAKREGEDRRRHLRGEGLGWVRVGTLDKTKSEVEELWADYESAAPITGTYEIDGTQYTGAVKPGTASYTPNTTGENGTNGCNVYKDVQVIKTGGIYKIECCGTAPCDLYQEDDPEQRRACFSLRSSIIEKTKGKMLMKDLTWGDEVLAANGVYQPYVLSIHSSRTQKNEFVQIYSSGADEQESPLELTENHMLFVKGKAEPIVAGQVNVGDFIIGKNGQRKVTSISRVTLEGFVTPLTRDATMLVDGVLASAWAVADGHPTSLNFGVVHIHMHDFLARLGSLIHFGCSYMDPYLCEARGDYNGDGETSYNMIFAAGGGVFLLPPFQRNLLLFLIPLAGVVVSTSYVLLKALTPFTVLAFIMAEVTKKNRLSGKVKFD
ncbi:hypothetical protein THAOC_10988 [Thalassiosira oceanica]|uniref:Hedgehog protein Hint domain-containing protein n=1 Tax=Thalassiosira oceanica TaxID=159749 RepID=K0T3E9_THAOC|nr:hypothetical protein THAOC_10988 [Thalassiosira oceanica]|eukprot:EJK67906.1 hypothetical protein THAOC_10988 [Thalassiosira oceanica]